MARTKRKSKKSARAETSAALTTTDTTSASTPNPLTVPELLVQAAGLIASQEYESALTICQQAVEFALTTEDAQLCTDSYEILGTIELELGFLDQAREHFLTCVKYAQTVPSPSPAPHLYLAQLSTPEESLTHFSNALTILQAKLAAIEHAKLGGDGGAGTEADAEEEGELRRSASRALVGMTELYLTDLCMEPDAEENCEKHLKLASEIDPSDPEVFSTLASVRLSQSRPEDAKLAASKGWQLWRKLGPESVEYPPASTRISLAKLFLELSQLSSALEILQRLEMEDDEDAEIWYLSGWTWWLLGETRTEPTEEEESQGECWSEAKLCLENYVKLDARDPSSSDPEQLTHVQELMGKLDAAGIVASLGQEEEGEGEGEWEDDSNPDQDVEMET